MSEERQGSTLGFCLREVSFLQRQMLLRNGRDQVLVTFSGGVRLKSNTVTEEWQGPTLGFCFREVSILQSQIL